MVPPIGAHIQIKVGLAGNLRDYRFVGRTGAVVTGSDVDYNGSPAGYAADPAETVTYVDAHDNETLFDLVTYKIIPYWKKQRYALHSRFKVLGDSGVYDLTLADETGHCTIGDLYYSATIGANEDATVGDLLGVVEALGDHEMHAHVAAAGGQHLRDDFRQ